MSAEKELPPPPVPTSADLRDFPFMPMFRSRLFSSSFNARATDSEWRAGVTLWMKSWDQVPAGSMPNDDIELCRLVDLGRDQRSWKKIRAGALHGWYLCSDGRLYHRVVAEGVLKALEEKLRHRWLRECQRIKKHNQRTKERIPTPTFEDWKSRGTPHFVSGDTPETSSGTRKGRPRAVPTKNPTRERERDRETEEGRSESSSQASNVSGLPLSERTSEKNGGRSRRRDARSLTRTLAARLVVPKS